MSCGGIQLLQNPSRLKIDQDIVRLGITQAPDEIILNQAIETITLRQTIEVSEVHYEEINVIQNPNSTRITTPRDSIVISRDGDSIEIHQASSAINIFQGSPIINVCAQNPMANFIPYSFVATVDNQTTFGPLNQVPLAIITLAITGTLQDPIGVIPDFTLVGLNIVLSSGVAAGNTVYGMLQVA